MGRIDKTQDFGQQLNYIFLFLNNFIYLILNQNYINLILIIINYFNINK
jgi:hypothetical protein